MNGVKGNAMRKERKKSGSVAIDTVPLPDKPVGKKVPRRGTVAIDTVPLPERDAHLARKMLKVERDMGRKQSFGTAGFTKE